MRAICYSRDTSTVAEKNFGCYKRLAAQTTEFWWMQLLLRLRSKSSHRKDAVQADAGGYQVLSDVRLPDEVAHLLKKGPKFSTEPSIPAHELLALNRCISRKAVLEDQERCLLDGVDSLRRTVTKNSPTSSALIKKTVSFFKDNELRLLLSDKESNFVVAPSAVFKDKAIRAVNKNFFPSTEKALKMHKDYMHRDITLKALPWKGRAHLQQGALLPADGLHQGTDDWVQLFWQLVQANQEGGQQGLHPAWNLP
ncbi:hypothetical protein HPB50_025064 [Hyalomma asiaticum]|uniref:Uncharacterized protein n=1 Tax=Hyalomma asiaticum TaxID=266040 RepID=A0ACB7TE58_HYAAI|nr:hypothetical protein HPB50_025064 [Hyalomma asiaticum]